MVITGPWDAATIVSVRQLPSTQIVILWPQGLLGQPNFENLSSIPLVQWHCNFEHLSKDYLHNHTCSDLLDRETQLIGLNQAIRRLNYLFIKNNRQINSQINFQARLIKRHITEAENRIPLVAICSSQFKPMWCIINKLQPVAYYCSVLVNVS